MQKVKTKRQPAPPPGLRLEWLDPDTLAPNPANWRRHPETQTTALRAALEEVGWAGALLYNERTKRLIDGHARKELKKGQLAPVLIGSWTEEQERLILATLDPLAAMASADATALQALLADVATGDEALKAMLADLAQQQGITPPDFQPVGIEEQGRLDEKAKTTCPECGHEFTL
jgi:hypothetical protein